jgi:DNA-damage-inducible protein D
MEKEKGLIVFQDKKIRRVWFNNEWWFSVIDVVSVLTDSQDSRNYWKVLKFRLKEEGSELVTFCNQLKMPAIDGKYYGTDCLNVKWLFRLIQSIPSPKAEPFKQWLANVGYQRVQEIENPELAQTRMRELYISKGYSEAWIEKRIRGIIVRDELTDEWKKKGVKQEKDFSILTAEISKATFNMTPSEYKKFKGLKKENLRDHMDDMELIFTMLGESVTKELTIKEKEAEFKKLKKVAEIGGTAAGNARKEIEKGLGRKISTKDNYLTISEKKKRLLKSPKNKKIIYKKEKK